MPEPGDAVAIVRFRRGIVGETRRVCHLVPIPEGDSVPEQLRSYCGQRFLPGEAEQLDGIKGMPCEVCVAISARKLSPPQLIPAMP